ncbi:hypothetical protein CfE428DRAFT_2278 [Chthoniobacter flavus Ellin428]|uniref:Uncharacterized protein n=1 Tax=Chthoniobacter flavus Ellin428 TaxID=497964 RepID=B4D040_9BACT|nr:hypothetical protein [Chthoniobacter flavus]EDY20354.1 hypothetical protein CfE428DRAFT_2278 [Chthoniobacter flavus Ellin428]TCO94247.1 hypothetical protein EV701_103336 [Chthoniobacter flavus]
MAAIYIQFFLHGLCEWAAVWAVAIWVAQGWTENPAPFPVEWVRHPQRVWLMVACGIAPALFYLVLHPLLMQLYTNRALVGLWVPISYGLSVIYGLFLGVAACCCVAPSSAQQELRAGLAATVSAAVIVVSYTLGAAFHFQLFLHALVAMAIALAILFIARLIIAVTLPQPAASLQPPPLSMDPAEAALVRPRRLWLAVIIGFLPTALFLTTLTIAFSKSFNIDQDTGKTLLWLCAAVSVVCCFTASILLFKRSTGGAIAGGILLLLLNAFMGFFFGCCASLSGTSFR